MNIERILLLVPGAVVLFSTLMSVYHTPEWVYLAAFMGANLLFAGLTGFCPMAKILTKLGFKHGPAFK